VHFGWFKYNIDKEVNFKHPDVLFNNTNFSWFVEFERSTFNVVFDNVMHPFTVIDEELKMMSEFAKIKYESMNKSIEFKVKLLPSNVKFPEKE